MEVALIMFAPDGTRRAFPITRDTTVIGRREDCDLRIPLSSVSRKHCQLIKDNEFVRVEDLGSANGTLCNGQRVELVVLKPGDVLTIGTTPFVVQINHNPPDDQIHPPKGTPAPPAAPAQPAPPRVKKPSSGKTLEEEIDDILSSDENSDSDIDLSRDSGSDK